MLTINIDTKTRTVNIVTKDTKLENERWITCKPHGKDAEDYYRLKVEGDETNKEAVERKFGKKEERKKKAEPKIDTQPKEAPKIDTETPKTEVEEPKQEPQTPATPEVEAQPKEQTEKKDVTQYTDEELDDKEREISKRQEEIAEKINEEIRNNEELKKLNEELDEAWKARTKNPRESSEYQEAVQKTQELEEKIRAKRADLEYEVGDKYYEERQRLSSEQSEIAEQQSSRQAKREQEISSLSDEGLKERIKEADRKIIDYASKRSEYISSDEQIQRLEGERKKLLDKYWNTKDDIERYDLGQKANAIAREINNRHAELDKEFEEKHSRELQRARDEREYCRAEQRTRAVAQEKKRHQESVSKIAEAHKNFKPAKTIAEAKETMAIITGHNESILPKTANVDNINQMNEASLQVLSEYGMHGLDTYGVGRMGRGVLMHANGEIVEISSKLAKASKEEIVETFESVAGEKRNIGIRDSIKRIKELIAQDEGKTEWWSASIKKDREKRLKELEEKSKFSRWTCQTSAETFVRDTTFHEFGHTVMYRAVDNDPHAEAVVVNAFKKAKKTGDIYKISEYASTKSAEFFAETFAMRQTKQKLPDYINEMLDYVISRK